MVNEIGCLFKSAWNIIFDNISPPILLAGFEAQRSSICIVVQLNLAEVSHYF